MLPSGKRADMKGGCFCGVVRYALLSTPYDTGWCHCRICQRTSGAPAVVFTTVPKGDLVFEQGRESLRSVATTSFGRRQFCGECGTLLTIQVDFQADEIDITAATLAPSGVAPGFHIFFADRVSWNEPGDALPRFDSWRPDTRGLPVS